MTDPAVARRLLVAGSLVLTAALSAVSSALSPDFPDGYAAQLAAIEAGGGAATVSALTFTLAQLPFLVAVLGVAHLVRRRSPRLAAVGGALAVLGGFGHAVFGGTAMVRLSMAADPANREAHAEVLSNLESGPALLFMVMGLLGTVLGLLLLAVAVWRSPAAPRWTGPLLVAFLVVEFVGSGLSEWAGYLAVLLYLAALTGLAGAALRSPRDLWASPADREAPAEPAPSAVS